MNKFIVGFIVGIGTMSIMIAVVTCDNPNSQNMPGRFVQENKMSNGDMCYTSGVQAISCVAHDQ